MDTAEGELISPEQIVKDHWKKYGRNYYSRYDYEELTVEQAKEVFAKLESKLNQFADEGEGNRADIFEYKDPVDGSISSNQGLRFMYPNGSRFVFRLSGTGSSGATVRIYLESYEKENVEQETAEALKDLVRKALEYSEINQVSERDGPTVIT
jgi:phosphoglucomutase